MVTPSRQPVVRNELTAARGPSQLHLRRLQPSEARELHAWISERHYLGRCPAGHRFALEFTDGRERAGAMLLGRPAVRSLDASVWLELSRMVFLEDAPKNSESRALAMMRRWVRVWAPQIRGLLAYSDRAVGHAGTIYAADGWAPFGTTSNGTVGWRNRPGRRGEDARPSRKIRWVRTP